MQPLITIVGATGQVGTALATQLLHQHVRVRAVARDAAKLDALRAQGAETCVGDIDDSPFLRAVCAGADAVWLMLPEHPYRPDFLDLKHRHAIQLAAAVEAAAVPRVVVLSATAVNPPSGIGPAAPNGALEALLAHIPQLGVVALRPAFFMENLLAAIPVIKHAGMFGGLIGADVMLPMIAAQDVTRVAVEYLKAPTFDGYHVHHLLGPRDYTFRTAMAILGAAVGMTDLRYVELVREDVRAMLLEVGCSENAAHALVELYASLNAGEVQCMAQRSPAMTTSTTLEAWANKVFAPAYAAHRPLLPA